jgi:hypothetical protein
MINESIINRRKVPYFAKEWYKKQNKLQDGTVAIKSTITPTKQIKEKDNKEKEVIEAKRKIR